MGPESSSLMATAISKEKGAERIIIMIEKITSKGRFRRGSLILGTSMESIWPIRSAWTDGFIWFARAIANTLIFECLNSQLAELSWEKDGKNFLPKIALG
jgi:hypothetical protein